MSNGEVSNGDLSQACTEMLLEEGMESHTLRMQEDAASAGSVHDLVGRAAGTKFSQIGTLEALATEVLLN